MPELPEVETVRRFLRRRLEKRRIDGVRVLEPRLRERVDAARLAARVPGRRIVRVARRAKYLLVGLDDGATIIIHLGMTGRLSLGPAGAAGGPHLHVAIRLEDGIELRFHDPRRFGLVAVIDAGELDRDARLARLGIEPLSRACTAGRLRELAQGLRRPIKSFLMDAERVAGVGNIYANEALFLAGLRPQRAAGRVSAAGWKRLTGSLKRVLRDAIRQGGTTLRDFRDVNGDAGRFQVRLRVYDRAGEKCLRCGARVRRAVLAGRSTFYCPRCQR
jgi:formamidopyrimidine-DNA glycosylase